MVAVSEQKHQLVAMILKHPQLLVDHEDVVIFFKNL